MEINKDDAPEGFEAVAMWGDEISPCAGCYFFGPNQVCPTAQEQPPRRKDGSLITCGSNSRDDGRDVIFLRREDAQPAPSFDPNALRAQSAIKYVDSALRLKVKRLRDDAILPKYQTAGAACFDLHAVVDHMPTDYEEGGYPVTHGHPISCRTGLAFEVPEGWVMLIFSRSGHGFKNDTRLANCVGVIDSDYRGEVSVKLTRDAEHGCSHLRIKRGDRIAQAMLVAVDQWQIVEVDELSETARGEGGFGSTGN